MIQICARGPPGRLENLPGPTALNFKTMCRYINRDLGALWAALDVSILSNRFFGSGRRIPRSHRQLSAGRDLRARLFLRLPAMTDFCARLARCRLPPFGCVRTPPGEQAQSGIRRALAVNTKSPNRRYDRFKHFCMTAVSRSRLPSQRSRNLSIRRNGTSPHVQAFARCYWGSQDSQHEHLRLAEQAFSDRVS